MGAGIKGGGGGGAEAGVRRSVLRRQSTSNLCRDVSSVQDISIC